MSDHNHLRLLAAGDMGAPTIPYAFDADRFDRAMASLGHTTDIARAEAAGITPMTLSRWRRGRFTTLPRTAMQAARAVGLTVEDLWVLKPGLKTIEERAAELAEMAPPMTDEQREAAVRILARVPPGFAGEPRIAGLAEVGAACLV